MADNPLVDGIKDVLFSSQSSLLLCPCRSMSKQFPEERDCYFSSCLLLCTTRRVVSIKSATYRVPHVYFRCIQ
jgi:hypothetical protein